MQSLVKAQEPSGWMMWPVMVQSHPWTDVPSVDGASTTVDMVKMQEWCAKVSRFIVSIGCTCIQNNFSVIHAQNAPHWGEGWQVPMYIAVLCE